MTEQPLADRTSTAWLRLITDAGNGLRGTDLVRYALDHAVAVTGALGGMVHLRGPGGLLLVAANGLVRTVVRDWGEVEEGGPTAPARAVAGGTWIWVSSEELPAARAGAFTGSTGLLAVPLLTTSGAAGALSVMTVAGDAPERRHVTAVEGLAAWVTARLLERPEAHERLAVARWDATESRTPALRYTETDRAANERNLRVIELTSALAEALTIRDIVNAAAERILPPFDATGLVVQLIERETIRVAGSVGYPQAFLEHLDGAPVSEISAVDDVYRTRIPVFIDTVDEYVARYPRTAVFPGAANKCSWAFLPLTVSGKAIGCCVVSFSKPRHLLGEERVLLTALSGLIAQAIERARLFDAEHARAQELQRGLLPHALPASGAVSAVARYLPAAGDVGGDWYDVIPLSGARVALVIGDVMGHGLPQAATMGQMRTAVRTLADLEYPPAELLTRLNDLAGDPSNDFHATCLYAVYDPVASTCTIACAGHPPPAVVDPAGTVRFVDLDPDPPIGSACLPYAAVDVPIPDGSLLVLYTDGLVESSTRDIDRGLTHLAEVLHDTVPHHSQTASARHVTKEEERESLERISDDVVAALLEKTQLADDTALLIARTHAIAPTDVATWSLPDQPIAASQARDLVDEQLARWGIGPLVTTTELLVSELVGNAVRHSNGPIGLRLLRSDTLICEVTDTSHTMPRIRQASDTDEGGRGLQLVAAYSQRWGARYTTAGKCVWTVQQLP